MEKIENIIELYDQIQKDEVTIKFEKKDKSIRLMRCTLNFDIIPEGNRIKTVNMSNILKLIKNSRLIHVYDLDNNGWRSIPFERAEWLETSDKKKYDVEIKGEADDYVH
jgi:hypothetical protein